MNVGDLVEKVGGDYTFKGTIVSRFGKLSGSIRFVVEDDRGVLHVYSEKNLKFVNNIKELSCETEKDQFTLGNDKVKARRNLLDMFIGPDNIFIKNLSSEVINSGEGIIKPVINFQHMSADINNIPISRLITWGSGFFRNDVTKQDQLLLHVNNEFVACIDDLPNSEVSINIYFAPFLNKPPRSLNELSDDELKFVFTGLSNKFASIKVLVDFR